MQDQTVQSF